MFMQMKAKEIFQSKENEKWTDDLEHMQLKPKEKVE
jgi:hypothetical protein